MQSIKTAARRIPDLPCACATLRRAARAVTQIYADEFQGMLEGSQFSLLNVLAKRPGIRQTDIAQILLLDKTTLSRNLSVMKRNGWLERVETDDRRERGFQLTVRGTEILEQGRPAWQRAQKRLRVALGSSDWQQLFEVANTVTRTAWHLTGTNTEGRSTNQ